MEILEKETQENGQRRTIRLGTKVSKHAGIEELYIQAYAAGLNLIRTDTITDTTEVFTLSREEALAFIEAYTAYIEDTQEPREISLAQTRRLAELYGITIEDPESDCDHWAVTTNTGRLRYPRNERELYTDVRQLIKDTKYLEECELKRIASGDTQKGKDNHVGNSTRSV